jgi:hypothetical protein
MISTMKHTHRDAPLPCPCLLTRPAAMGLVLLGAMLPATFAAEPTGSDPKISIVELKRADGDSDIRIDNQITGQKASYRIPLRRQHHPATDENNPAIERWKSWRYGAFLCFNTNQFTGHEHCRARDPQVFAPDSLPVDQWVEQVKSFRMRYAVLTARHSGFLLWDSPTTQFDIASSPAAGTDVVGQYVAACRKQGIAPGLYYCLWGGSYKPDPNARAIILAQLHELATRYGPIPYFWIDMATWLPKDLSQQEVYNLLKNTNPDCVVIFNQYRQPGTEVRNFPSDVLNGEMRSPPPEGHDPWRHVGGRRYYLPFEYEPCSQKRAPSHHEDYGPYAWFTYSTTKGHGPSVPYPAEFLLKYIRRAYQRGASNVLIACAPDHTGSFRAKDVEQLTKLGNLLDEAGVLDAKKD